MYNPLCLFSDRLLDAFIKAEKKNFVRQTYPRGFAISDHAIKGCFLISHYGNINHALQHFEALREDKNRHLYEWEKEEDQKRLKLAATQPGGYRIFASVVMPGWKEKAEVVLKPKIMRYIDSSLQWHPARRDSVDFDLYPQNGEVFVALKLKTQVVKVSLGEIEGVGGET